MALPLAAEVRHPFKPRRDGVAAPHAGLRLRVDLWNQS
jgi:hypothetical protein